MGIPFVSFVSWIGANSVFRNGNGQGEWIKSEGVKGKESALLWFVLAACGGSAAAGEVICVCVRFF
jgi:hypothetical protein